MKRARIAMYTAGVLLMLTLVSVRLVFGLYARYVTSDSANDNARVARFGVTGGGFSETINLGTQMKPGESLEKEFMVTNKSEVSVRYVLRVQNTTKNLPLTLTVNSEDQTDAFNSDTGYYYSKVLGPNVTAQEQFAFVIAWPADSNDIVYSGQLDNIAITVTAVQVD